ncbi:MAG: energy-coupling factor ABC transporter permease [Chloroflexi bacterium]|nr:energy-coupling factor ABC transporter permease [Chloroflexota bacterium]
MHIPDGFLNLTTAASTYVVSAGAIGYSVRETHKKIGERQVPLMGMMGAFIFAAQMLNFPVIGGTSGHLIGGALAAILLGPWSAVLVITAVLAVQCFLFQDGGVTALGANVLNMGVIASFVGYYLYNGLTALLGGSKSVRLVGGFLGAWASVFLAAVACALELVVSDISPLVVVLPAMAGIHALIGIGEGLITAAVLSFVLATRKDLLALERI